MVTDHRSAAGIVIRNGMDWEIAAGTYGDACPYCGANAWRWWWQERDTWIELDDAQIPYHRSAYREALAVSPIVTCIDVCLACGECVT